MGKDPLKRDRRYDDAGNSVSRERLIERNLRRDRQAQQQDPRPAPRA
jgi:hypothetical protein